MTDTERLAWLEEEYGRLQDVYWRVQNERQSVGEAIDFLADAHARAVAAAVGPGVMQAASEMSPASGTATIVPVPGEHAGDLFALKRKT